MEFEPFCGFFYKTNYKILYIYLLYTSIYKEIVKIEKRQRFAIYIADFVVRFVKKNHKKADTPYLFFRVKFVGKEGEVPI